MRSLANKVYTYIILPLGLTNTFFDKFPRCDLKGESHIFVYMDKIFSQHYFSNSLCNSLAELNNKSRPHLYTYVDRVKGRKGAVLVRA